MKEQTLNLFEAHYRYPGNNYSYHQLIKMIKHIDSSMKHLQDIAMYTGLRGFILFQKPISSIHTIYHI